MISVLYLNRRRYLLDSFVIFLHVVIPVDVSYFSSAFAREPIYHARMANYHVPLGMRTVELPRAHGPFRVQYLSGEPMSL